MNRTGETKNYRATVIIPAFNEEECIGTVVREVRRHNPTFDVTVINDGSSDGTSSEARKAGARVLDLPFNLGVGEAVQAGFLYAYEEGYDYAVRCDADGQHQPVEIGGLLQALVESDVDLVIGSRFLGEGTYSAGFVRNLGIFALSWFLSRICRKKVSDPTSGFQALNRPLIYFFSRSYPKDYPEPEALALMRRQGYDFMEHPASFKERISGQSSIGSWGTLYYAFKVFLALLVDRARPVESRYARWMVLQRGIR